MRESDRQVGRTGGGEREREEKREETGREREGSRVENAEGMGEKEHLDAAREGGGAAFLAALRRRLFLRRTIQHPPQLEEARGGA
jgi:hypothetical protein